MRPRPLTSALFVAVAISCVALWPQAAAAASTPTTPTAVGGLEVQLWPGAVEGQAIAIIALTLPEDTELPARVSIPIPAGTTVDWAGEIGGTSEQDVARGYSVEQGAGGSVVVFDMLKWREAQVEVSGLPLSNANGALSAKLDHVQSAAATSTAFSVRLPAGATDVDIVPAPASGPEINEAGESLYTLPSVVLKDGATHAISVTYKLGATATEGAGAGSGPTRGNFIAVLAGIAVVLVALLVVVVRIEQSKRA